jgi:alcohol dehydrogenase
MRAAVFKGEKEPMEVEDIDEPQFGPDDVLVETEACGVCRSDWHAWQGDWDWLGVSPSEGQVFGHEPVGKVVEVGSNVETVREGERVAAPFNMSGGTCPYCRDGRSNICDNRIPLGFMSFAPGAFAERFPLRNADANAVHIPDGIDPVDVASLGCRFATSFHALSHQSDIGAGDWVAIHGCGGIGLSAVHIADALGANIIAVDIMDDKLDKALELGADQTVNATEVQDVPQAVKKVTDGSRGVDISMDALGVAETIQNSVNSLCKGGQHLQVGLTTQEEEGWVELPIDNMVYDEREIISCIGMQPNRYDEIFRMMESGKLSPGKIVSETIDLDSVPETIQSLGDYDTIGIPVCNEF